MDIEKLEAAAQAVLFASGEPVSLERLSQVLEVDKNTLSKVIKNLEDRLNENNSGIMMVRLAGSFQLSSKREYAAYIARALDIRRNLPLSQAAMEVLSVVAYNQPVTKAFVEQVRGVDCSGVMGSLVNKGLIEEVKRLDLPGRPMAYGTTPNFLRCFELSCLEDLPPLPHKQPMHEGEQEDEEQTLDG